MPVLYMVLDLRHASVVFEFRILFLESSRPIMNIAILNRISWPSLTEAEWEPTELKTSALPPEPDEPSVTLAIGT